MKLAIYSVGILVVLLLILCLISVYHIGAAADADLLYSQKEAWIFINVADIGWHQNYPEYLFSRLKERFLPVGTPYRDRHSRLLVLHITNSGIERYSCDGISPDFYTPFGGSIYANNEGSLLKWDGNRFIRASAEEDRDYHAQSQLGGGEPAHEDWTIQRSVLNRGMRETSFPISLSGSPATVVVRHGKALSDASIDLVRGEHSDQIWHLVQQPHRANAQEYKKIFGD
jgi:hypothetical protein